MSNFHEDRLKELPVWSGEFVIKHFVMSYTTVRLTVEYI
jgi:hypothetical protein